MKYKTAIIAAIASTFLAGPVMAQENSSTNAEKPAAATQDKDVKHKRGPVDLEKFSRMERLKTADTNGDGTLSREEIEAMVAKQTVKRQADRMERRLDVNGDGKVTLDEIANQRKKEFAALDRNNDGKIDRAEMRAAHRGHRNKAQMHKRHQMDQHQRGDHKAAEQAPAADQNKAPQQ